MPGSRWNARSEWWANARRDSDKRLNVVVYGITLKAAGKCKTFVRYRTKENFMANIWEAVATYRDA
jgi:hypothetical protein